MSKRILTLYMKNGKSYNLTCDSHSTYSSFISTIDNGEKVEFEYDGKIVSFNGSQVDYYECEYVKEEKKSIFDDPSLYRIINGKRFATQKLVDLLEARNRNKKPWHK